MKENHFHFCCCKKQGEGTLAGGPAPPGLARNRSERVGLLVQFPPRVDDWESCLLWGDVTPPLILPETTCLGPLQNKACSSLLDQCGEAMAEFPTAQDTDPMADDIFYTVENDGSGEVYLCSDMGEAYEKIATLAEYLLKDQEGQPGGEEFGSLFSDSAAAEASAEAQKWGRSDGPSGAPEGKRRKLAYPPALRAATAVAAAASIPPHPSPAGAAAAPPDFHVPFLVAAVGPVGRPPEALGSSAHPALWCFSLNGSLIPVTFACEGVCAQPPPLPAGLGTARLQIAPGEGEHLGSQPPPLEPASPNPGLVESFQRRLREHFRAAEASLGPLYLDGDLVQHHKDYRAPRSTDRRICSRAEKWGSPVERQRLFQLPGSRVLLVLGKAGMGKSLLVQKICLDWANGQLAQFDFVFQFDCRWLGLLLGSPRDLKHLLFSSLGGPWEGADAAYEQLLQKPAKVLLIFDGVEALKDHKSTPSGLGRPPRLGALLAGLFQKKWLNGCTLLFTGQPRERLPRHLPPADTVLEVMGFSAEQASLYVARYFEGCAQEANLIRNHPYLVSHCACPGLCQLICQAVFATRGEEPPSTLTSLVAKFLLHKLGREGGDGLAPKFQKLLVLAEVAWSLAQWDQGTLRSSWFPSEEVKAFALETGLVVPLASPRNSGTWEEEEGYAFCNFVVQSFLVALHLTLTKEVKGKQLSKYLCMVSRSRKSLSSWDLVPRFLSGLLFLEDDLGDAFLFGQGREPETEKAVIRKQRCLSRSIRKLSLGEPSPGTLLQLLHCVHETENQHLCQHLALALKPELSFAGVLLSPPDVSVLHSVLRRSPKKFALDLSGSRVPLDGLRKLVDLKNVTRFRVPLGEAVKLWKHLWDARAGEQLQAAMERFLLLVPFRARTMKDVDALLSLVRLQREIAERKDSGGSSIPRIPAIAGLRQLEVTLGPSYGLKGFQKLVPFLAAFPALQHLDLDSPNENEIGDEGVTALAGVLSHLASLETLNLSQNKITDLGAGQLATALPSGPRLKTLSLYKNQIGDAGAGHLAQALPQMAALRVVDLQCNKISAAGARHLTDTLRECPCIQSMALWNATIPHGVFDHLQQLDSRVRRL